MLHKCTCLFGAAWANKWSGECILSRGQGYITQARSLSLFLRCETTLTYGRGGGVALDGASFWSHFRTGVVQLWVARFEHFWGPRESKCLITDTFNLTKAFQKILFLFEPQLKNNNVHHFPLLKEFGKSSWFDYSKYTKEIRNRTAAFESRFSNSDLDKLTTFLKYIYLHVDVGPQNASKWDWLTYSATFN